jgi:hypothetical protein
MAHGRDPKMNENYPRILLVGAMGTAVEAEIPYTVLNVKRFVHSVLFRLTVYVHIRSIVY